MRQPKSSKLRERVHGLFDKFSSYVLVFLIFVLAVSLIRNISNVKRAEEVISNKRLDVEKLRKEKEETEKRLEYAKSQEYVEKQLRDTLGLAKQGEIVVILPPPKTLQKFAPKYEEEIVEAPDPNWRKWMKLFI